MSVRITGQQHALKNSMHVFQTAGAPPSSGSTMRPNIGCTENKSVALIRSSMNKDEHQTAHERRERAKRPCSLKESSPESERRSTSVERLSPSFPTG